MRTFVPTSLPLRPYLCEENLPGETVEEVTTLALESAVQKEPGV
jgi:hypothetical protein